MRDNHRGLRSDIYLQAILKYCILPLFEIDLRNGTFEYFRALSDFFNVDYREVYFVKATKPFTLPGRLVGCTNAITAKWGMRAITEGFPFLLRYDTRNPGLVELEHWPKSKLEQTFHLSKLEWETIRQSMTVVYKVRNKLKSLSSKRSLQYHADFVRLHLGCEFKIKIID